MKKKKNKYKLDFMKYNGQIKYKVLTNALSGGSY